MKNESVFCFCLNVMCISVYNVTYILLLLMIKKSLKAEDTVQLVWCLPYMKPWV